MYYVSVLMFYPLLGLSVQLFCHVAARKWCLMELDCWMIMTAHATVKCFLCSAVELRFGWQRCMCDMISCEVTATTSWHLALNFDHCFLLQSSCGLPCRIGGTTARLGGMANWSALAWMVQLWDRWTMDGWRCSGISIETGSRPKRWEGADSAWWAASRSRSSSSSSRTSSSLGDKEEGREEYGKTKKRTCEKRGNFFPPDQVVYATVQWVLKDYQNKDNPRLFSPIVDDINAMGCTISLRNHKAGQSSRVTIKGEKARDAFLEFLSRTADVFGDLDLTRVSNVQMHLGAEMLHEVKQTVDEAAKAGIV